MKKLSLPLALFAVSLFSFAGFTAADNNPSSTQFDCVGTLYKNGQAQAYCALVSSNYVVVMAHLLVNNESRLEKIPNSNITLNKPYRKLLSDVNSIQVKFNDKIYDCDKYLVYPQYISDSLEGDCDIALIKLKDNVTGISPAIINTLFNEKQYKVVCFGLNSKSNDYNEENLIDTIGGGVLNGNSESLVCDVSKHQMNQNNLNADLIFSKENDRYQLSGIGSFLSYGVTANVVSKNWTRVSVFADWINKTIAQN